MMFTNIYFLALIQNHIIFKVFLWGCLLILVGYIIFIELKVLRKENVHKSELNENQLNLKEIKEEYNKNISFYEKKAKTLIILLITMSIITLVLTFTY